MQKKHKAIFLGLIFEKANFPHFRHDNSANIPYSLKFKLSGQVVTPLLLGMNKNMRILLRFGKDIAILDEQL